MTADLAKLIRDVFNPRRGENVVLLNDYPSDSLFIDREYLDVIIIFNNLFLPMEKLLYM